MNQFSTADWAQFILFGIGVLLIVLPPTIYLLKLGSRPRNFDLEGVQKANVVTPSKPSRKTIAAYQPVPVEATSHPYHRVVEEPKAVRAGDLKKTAKMHFNRALRSSQRLLTAVRREVLPDVTPPQGNNIG